MYIILFEEKNLSLIIINLEVVARAQKAARFVNKECRARHLEQS